MIETIGNGWMWAGFVAFIGVMVAIDMLLLGRQGAHRVSAREAGAWSAVWIALALAFNAGLWWWLDGELGRDIANQKALEFLTGYLVEKALAVDNIFVFVMIYSYFAVPAE
jgi:tellurite resistance protein TerC